MHILVACLIFFYTFNIVFGRKGENQIKDRKVQRKVLGVPSNFGIDYLKVVPHSEMYTNIKIFI